MPRKEHMTTEQEPGGALVPSSTLLACPFCGLTENLRQEDHTGDDPWFAVICRTRRCGAMIGSPNSYAEAAERWNRRANNNLSGGS